MSVVTPCFRLCNLNRMNSPSRIATKTASGTMMPTAIFPWVLRPFGGGLGDMEPVVAASSCVVDEGIECDEDEYRGDDDDRGVIDVDSVAGPLVPGFRGGNPGDVGTPVGTDTRVEEAADPVAVTGEVSVVTAWAWVVTATS